VSARLPGRSVSRGRPRGAFRLAAPLAAALLLLPGCFATTKHLEQVQTDMTRADAWVEETLSRQDAELDALRAENEALRQRMDDLADQITALGGEVSSRLTELARSDQQVSEQLSVALRSTDVLAEQRQKDREENVENMNAILDEVLKDNRDLRARLETLERSAYTFGRMHKVKKGESVASIAAQYGVTAQAIVEVRAAAARREAEFQAVKAERMDVAKSLAGVTVTIAMKAAEGGHLYGSVGARQVSVALVEAGEGAPVGR